MNHLNVKVVEKIVALEAESAALDYSLEASREASEYVTHMMESIIEGDRDLTEEDKAEFQRLGQFIRKANIADEIERLEMTQMQELVEVQTQFLITDGDLVSPAGFHPSERVFVKTDVFIQTNRLPASLSGNLKAYDINKVAAQ